MTRSGDLGIPPDPPAHPPGKEVLGPEATMPGAMVHLEKAVLEAMPAETCLFDAEGRFLYVTPSVIRDDATRRWVVGRTLHEWCRARGHPAVLADRRRDAIRRVVAEGRSVTLEEVRLEPLGGRRRYVQMFEPLVSPDGLVDRVMSVAVELPSGESGGAVRVPSGDGGQEWVRLRDAEAALRAEVDELTRLSRIRQAAEDARVLRARRLYPPEAPGGLLHSLHEAVDAVSSTWTPALIVAEPGIPAAVVARAVHDAGPSRDGPFVSLDCGTFRAESPLLPDGGTLFLEHVASLPLEEQDRLLAALESPRRSPEGDASPGSRVRLVASTSCDLAAACEAGRFRSELLLRLGALPLHVPPLRHRPADVERLSRRYLEEAAGRLGRRIRTLTPAEIERLQAYRWPGNDLELRCVMERAAILAQGERPLIRVPDAERAPGEPTEAVQGFLTETQMRERERQNLVAVLARTDGKIYGEDGAAALLGIPPTTLASRMRKMGLG